MKKIFKTVKEFCIRNAKTLTVTALFGIAAAACFHAGYYFGNHEFYYTLNGEKIAYSKDELLAGERRYCGAALSLLHKFYGNDDNEFWFDVVQNLPEYRAIEQANGGDWEDFYSWQELPLNAENYYNINGEIYIAE